jgi:hypothetical protein
VRCPPDAVQPAGLVCRPPLDPICDVAEVCDGREPVCPHDRVAPIGTDCGCGTCDGAGMCSCGCSYGEADCDMDGDCESCNVPPQPDPGPCGYWEITCEGRRGFRCGEYLAIPAGQPCRGTPGVCDGAGGCSPIDGP